MSRKIVVNLRDTFAPGEFSRLSALLIHTLRTEFPGFIVHTNLIPKYREAFVTYAFGLWGEGEAEAALTSACKTVSRLLSNVGWRNENQPVLPSAEVEPPVWTASTVEASPDDESED